MARGRLLLIIAIGETIKPLVILCCFLVVSLVRAGDGTSCNVPSITKVNFQNYIEILNGTSRTLSCEIHSDTPLKTTWRKDSSRLSTDIKYSVENSSCSNSTSQTCIVSNLTLINAVRFKDKSLYVGNYSLTAENDCGIATVYVGVDIYIPSSCDDDYSKPPQLKTAPPSVIQAVERHSVTITAQYEGNKDDKNLGVYWCVYKTQHDYYCYNISEDDNYDVSTDGCPPDNENCCYFTVLLKIKSVTRNLTLQSMVVWQQDPQSFIPGNSNLVANVYPTLDKRIPNANNQSVNEGQSTEFTCIYNASTDPNITITTWKFNEELLKRNSSHYTIITQYGNDPVNINHVLSRITFFNVKPDNEGIYTCQCLYNSEIIVNDKDVVSEAADFHLKVKPSLTVKSGKNFPLLYIILIVVGAVILIVVSVVVIVVIVVLLSWWKRRKNKNCDKAKTSDEEAPLLEENDRGEQMEDVVASINVEQAGSENDRERSPSRSLSDDASSTDHDKNGHIDQPVTSKQNVQHGSNKAAGTKKPLISVLPTKKAVESEPEGPRTQHPAAVRPPGNELVVPRPAKNNIPSGDSERVTVEPSTGCYNKILNLIAPDFNNVNMVTLLPYLREHLLVTRDEEHHLSITIHSSVEKAQLLLGYLKAKGDDSLQKILCCLNLAHEHSGHKQIAIKLKQIMEDNNIECADFCAEHSK